MPDSVVTVLQSNFTSAVWETKEWTVVPRTDDLITYDIASSVP